MVEPASDPQYKDKNDLANVVLPIEPQYMAIMNGQPVEPETRSKRSRAKPVARPRPAGRSRRRAGSSSKGCSRRSSRTAARVALQPG
jgi:hypothetical protein